MILYTCEHCGDDSPNKTCAVCGTEGTRAVMELMLLTPVEGVGDKFEIVVVDRFLALNKLLPQRLALVATPLVRKRYKGLIKEAASVQ